MPELVAGYGVIGTDDKESPDVNLTKAPASLKIDDMVAVTTWLYVHDGQRPPSPAKIVKAYRKFMTPQDWKDVTTIQPPAPKSPPGFVNASLLATGEEPVEEIFRKAQCGMCHIIPGIPDVISSSRTMGPSLNMRSVAPLRLKDPKYNGKATTAREYITESILYPSVHVPDSYRDHLMPKVYGTLLSGLALDKMVEYLAEAGKEPSPLN